MLLGGWFLVLRFHQAVARAWPEVGPALGVPVLVGQHGTGPWQVSVFQPDEPDSDRVLPQGLAVVPYPDLGLGRATAAA